MLMLLGMIIGCYLFGEYLTTANHFRWCVRGCVRVDSRM